MYDKDQDVARDFNEAFKWYIKAAEQGYAEARFNLGLIYANVQWIAHDYIEDYKWASIAVVISGESDKLLLEFIEILRDNLNKIMLTAQIKESNRRAKMWIIKHLKDIN